MRRRVNLVGPQKQTVRGSLNGHAAAAVPDTGCDALLVSKDFANKNGLKTIKDPGRGVKLQFADGSTAYTDVMLVNAEWQYKTKSESASHETLYVLEGLNSDVILSNDYLYASESFTMFSDVFTDWRADDAADGESNLYIIGNSISWNEFRRGASKIV